MALTLIVCLVGAAGMYAFERDVSAPDGIHDFGSALWWTAMVITTMGSQYWPQTAEGRVLCLGLALYAFAVFGYVAATIASFFVTRESEGKQADLASASAIESLHAEVKELRAELRKYSNDRSKAS
jgi:voltage-gated potassium channel